MVTDFTGRVIAGKYVLASAIGRGGMGIVYRARHLGTGGEVAVKLMLGDAGDPAEAKRFALEAQNAAQLQHTATIRVIDFGADGELLYLVMELLHGRPLNHVLFAERRLPWRRTANIVRQILGALWEAHEHNARIVHRDLKPGNLFIIEQPGGDELVKVLDFGLSRSLIGTGAGTRGIVGTPLYMAPELWVGEAIDGRTDLYALGCVTFEMLTGRPPFVPPSGSADLLLPLAELHCTEPPPRLAAVARDVPPEFAAWVDRLLVKAPEGRFPSAREALCQLDEILAENAALAAPADAPPRDAQPGAGLFVAPPRPRSFRNRWLFAALLVAVLAALGVFMVTRPGAPPVLCEPANVAAQAGLERESYQARLGPADHTNSRGERLATASAVLVRDRENYHAAASARVRDPDDESDIFFVSADDRAVLTALLGRVLERPLHDAESASRVREAILDGTPLVRIDWYLPGGGLCVGIVGD